MEIIEYVLLPNTVNAGGVDSKLTGRAVWAKADPNKAIARIVRCFFMDSILKNV